MTKMRPESDLDADAIETLLDAVFGSGRHAKTSYRYRDGVEPIKELSHIVHDAGTLVATIRYWPITIGPGKTPALLLGPIAVEPARKGEGIGIKLILETLEQAASMGARVVVLVGELPYYARFGFHTAGNYGITMADEAPERVQVLFLDESLKGKLAGAIEKVGTGAQGVA